MSLKWTDKRKYKFLWQRIFRGYGDDETWSLDHEVSRFILPRLIRFKELNNGHPAGLTEKKWNNILDKMIFAFQRKIDDPIEYDSVKEKKMQEGFCLFGKYFQDLWW